MRHQGPRGSLQRVGSDGSYDSVRHTEELLREPPGADVRLQSLCPQSLCPHTLR
ncbi:F-box protein [Clarias magur]|uniref:F-box protein n=1 Tax=Clarias magur TaxID=1594786 RepID=A0A8J4UAT6_CLAMG|nr:F-box protein [Clarias magur]